MSQKLQNDKIGSLSHSAGNIIMAASIASPAYLTIGGRQFVITSNLSVTLPTLTANQRYQVFAVQSAGVPSLVISTNENSVGPSGFTRWKLIGSLMASGGNGFNGNTIEFGTFVTITGVPRTLNKYNAGRLIFTAHTADPVKGNGGIGNTDRLLIEFVGSNVKAYGEYAQSVAGSPGTGNYFITLPFAIDLLKQQANTDNFSGVGGTWNGYSQIGHGMQTSSTSVGDMKIQPYDSNKVRFWGKFMVANSIFNTGGWGSNYYGFNNSDLEATFSLDYESSTLSSIPLEDR